MTQEQEWLKKVRDLLVASGELPEEADSADGSDGSIHRVSERGYGFRLGPDGILRCVFSVDLEDVRALISDDTTEDLSLDELCRVAREELRPMMSRCRRRLMQTGFEEEVVSDEDQYAIVYKKSFQGSDPAEVRDVLKWYWGVLTTGAGSR